jgi:hypothetical protein
MKYGEKFKYSWIQHTKIKPLICIKTDGAVITKTLQCLSEGMSKLFKLIDMPYGFFMVIAFKHAAVLYKYYCDCSQPAPLLSHHIF